eukprot:tig00021275_g19886.t1
MEVEAGGAAPATAAAPTSAGASGAAAVPGRAPCRGRARLGAPARPLCPARPPCPPRVRARARGLPRGGPAAPPAIPPPAPPAPAAPEVPVKQEPAKSPEELAAERAALAAERAAREAREKQEAEARAAAEKARRFWVEGAAAVYCGDKHCAVVTRNGRLFTWGRGGSGRTGHGDQADSGVPRRVRAVPPVVDMSLGGEHTLAVAADGEVYAFGHTSFGSMQVNSLRPVHIEFETREHGKVLQVCAGGPSPRMALGRELHRGEGLHPQPVPGVGSAGGEAGRPPRFLCCAEAGCVVLEDEEGPEDPAPPPPPDPPIKKKRRPNPQFGAINRAKMNGALLLPEFECCFYCQQPRPGLGEVLWCERCLRGHHVQCARAKHGASIPLDEDGFWRCPLC